MKRNRFVVILVAMAMSMLLVQGALAADEELGELVASIEVDRSAVVDDLVNSLATDDATAEQLRATLEALSASKLAEIYANAATLDDVTSILSEDILALGDLDKDYVYTPISPCRIIDTRNAGGAFSPGTRREFNVYGNTAAQGGAVCNSPRGEPRGVHIYIVAVPVAGQGNFGAFPANIAPPNAAILNYRTGVQNIGNAATIKTYYNIGSRDIEFINRFGTSHLVVDILGYYHEVSDDLAGVDWSSTNIVPISNTSTESPALLRQQTITCPGVGTRYVVATGSTYVALYSGSIFPDVARVRTSLSSTSSYNFATEGFFGLQNVTPTNAFLGYGAISKSHVFTCTGGSSLTVRYFASTDGTAGVSTFAGDISLVLTVYPRKY